MSVQVTSIFRFTRRFTNVLDAVLLLAFGFSLMFFVTGDDRATWLLLLTSVYGFFRFLWLFFTVQGRRRLLFFVPALFVVAVVAVAIAPARSRWMLRWDLDVYRRIAIACREASSNHGSCNLSDVDQKLVRFAHTHESSWGTAVWLKPRHHYVYLVHVPERSIETRALEEERCARPFEPGWILMYRC